MAGVLHAYDAALPPAGPALLGWLRRHRPDDRLARLGPAPSRPDLPEPHHALRCPFGRTSLAGAPLSRLADAVDAQLVHAWTVRSAGAAMGEARPVLLSLFAPPEPTEARQLQAIREADLPGTLHLLAGSETLAARLADLGVPAERVHHLSWPGLAEPADAERRRAVRQRMGLSGEDWVVLAPPQRLAGPALRLAVWVADVLRHADPATRLVVPGAGPAVEKARRFARTSGCPELVRFGGPDADAWAAADAVLLADEAGWGQAPLAMAVRARLPVLAGAAGELGALLEDGETALLAEPTAKPLCQALYRLRHEPGLAERLARAAAQRWADTFSPPAALAALEALYERLAETHRTPRRR